MPLSCTCYSDPDDFEWWFFAPEDFSVMPEMSRRKRCCSCKEKIDVGAQCLKFRRERSAKTDIEERICGDTIELATWFMCEHCGEIYLNLEDIGYCINDIEENMNSLLEEYHVISGFKAAA